jgi:hypothetical protein
LKGLTVTFQAAAALFATVPGISTIAGGIAAPPGRDKLFGGFMLAFGVLTLLGLAMFQERIRRLEPRRAARLVLFGALLSIVGLVGYTVLMNLCVVQDEDERSPGRVITDTVYMPIVPTGRLAGMIHEAGGRHAAVRRYLAPAVRDEVVNQPVAMAVTDGVLLIAYQTITTALVFAFGIAGWRAPSDGQ